MDAPFTSAGSLEALMERAERDVRAHAAFHMAYQGDASRLAADAAAGFPRLARWAAEARRALAPLREEILIRLRAWCRRLAPRLTPWLKERLLLPG